MCVSNKGVENNMAVLPGSLDYLYHNGIIDHIPYEAYEQPKMIKKQSVTPYTEKSLRESILDEAEKTKAKPSNKKTLIKGLVAVAALAVTTVCLLKGKLNPFKWFKK